jgi:hypothetical protein
MTNTNNRVVIDLTNTLQTKRPRRTPPPPPPRDSQLAQIHSAISAATTLLATLSNLATRIALAAPPATPETQNGVLADLATLAPVGVFADLATLAPNPATIQATPAPLQKVSRRRLKPWLESWPTL